MPFINMFSKEDKGRLNAESSSVAVDVRRVDVGPGRVRVEAHGHNHFYSTHGAALAQSSKLELQFEV